jgi:hypothetical protein
MDVEMYNEQTSEHTGNHWSGIDLQDSAAELSGGQEIDGD